MKNNSFIDISVPRNFVHDCTLVRTVSALKASRTDFGLCSYGKFSSWLPRWKNVQRPTKKPVQPKALGTNVSANFKLVNKHSTTYSCIVCTLSIVSYRCYAATAEWLSSAVENTAGQAQCCNPGSMLQSSPLYCKSDPVFNWNLKWRKQMRLNQSKRSCWHKPGRTDLWWKNIWTGVAPEECWKENFRMLRACFLNLVSELRPCISPNPKSPNHRALSTENR